MSRKTKAELEARVKELEQELEGCNKTVARLRNVAERSAKERKLLEKRLAGAYARHGDNFPLKWDFFALRYDHYVDEKGITNLTEARDKAYKDTAEKFGDGFDDDFARKKLKKRDDDKRVSNKVPPQE